MKRYPTPIAGDPGPSRGAPARGLLAGTALGVLWAAAAAIYPGVFGCAYFVETLLLPFALGVGVCAITGLVAGIAFDFFRYANGDRQTRDQTFGAVLWGALVVTMVGPLFHQLILRDFLGLESSVLLTGGWIALVAGATAMAYLLGRLSCRYPNMLGPVLVAEWTVLAVGLQLLWVLPRLTEEGFLSGKSLAWDGVVVFGLMLLYGLAKLARCRWMDVELQWISFRTCALLFFSGIGLCLALWSFSNTISAFQIRRMDKSDAKAPESRPNAILLVIDTLRADHCSFNGYSKETTPTLARFAEEAVLFSNAIAPSSWTLPSHASMLTGLYPIEHGARFFSEEELASQGVDPFQDSFSLHEENLTLAEILRSRGWSTGAVVANSARLDPVYGVSQGFEYYDSRRVSSASFPSWDSWLVRRLEQSLPHWWRSTRFGTAARDAIRINAGLDKWLDVGTARPFFLLVNYIDPHYPYYPPARFRPSELPVHFDFDALYRDVLMAEQELEPEVREVLMGLYDAEIAYVDWAIGEFFAELRRRQLFDSSMIVVTSDHGEAFAEHGTLSHGLTVYQEEVHVPLLVKYPGSRRIGVVEAPIGLTEIFGMILTELGVQDPLGRVKEPVGAKEVPWLAEVGVQRYFLRYGEKFRRGLRMVQSNGQKYLRSSLGGEELYDLARDPDERQSLVDSDLQTTQGLRELLDLEFRSLRRPPDSRTAPRADADQIEALRALGYID